jgi:hypothetical protein
MVNVVYLRMKISFFNGLNLDLWCHGVHYGEEKSLYLKNIDILQQTYRLILFLDAIHNFIFIISFSCQSNSTLNKHYQKCKSEKHILHN